MPKTEQTAEAKTTGKGRPPLPATQAIMDKILSGVKAEPGVKSAELAKKIGISSLQCSQLARRMANDGVLTVTKHEDNTLSYAAN